MRFTKLTSGLVAMCFSMFVGTPSATALTFIEFDRLKAHQKESFIETALHFYYFGYQNSSETAYKATCMVSLENQKVQGGNSYLLSLILRDFALIRANAPDLYTVEGVIEAVIDRECN
jgi:hypothetical protein